MVSGEKLHIVPLVLLFLSIMMFSGCITLTNSYIPDKYLQNGWYENLALRNTGVQVFGLEKWSSITYGVEGKLPAFLTITTYKTLILPDKQHLLKQIENIILNTFQDQIIINKSSKSAGSRILSQHHKSNFLIYDGVDISDKENRLVKLIGEVWICDSSGSSIICVGIAHVTQSDGSENFQQWSIMVMDPVGSIDNCTGSDGLIFNIICH